MTAYYNEVDPYCAAWLQNLMDADHIAPGVIDTRSIEDVRPDELAGYTQCHFFAGIGVWSLALRSAGWPDSRRAWTGSCPCQPFSAAGKGAGFADERHLWPAWQHLINQCRPAVLFGEQVASKAVDAWIDLVHADLEGMGYAFGGIAFPSAGVGAPHIRDRTYWVADAAVHGCDWTEERGSSSPREEDRRVLQPEGRSAIGGMADTEHDGRDRPNRIASIADRNESDERIPDGDCPAGGLGHADSEHETSQPRVFAGSITTCARDQLRPSPTNGFWRAADWLGCTDGKWRPVEPGTFPLAHGATSRVGRLRAYGNAINAEAAKAFIEGYCEARGLIEMEKAA